MRKKLSIAVLIDAWFPFYGGGQVHVREISKRLVGQCEFRFYHSRSPQMLSRLIWALTVIPQIIQDHNKKPFDLVHAHAYIAGIPGKILSMVLRIPVVYTVHGCNTLDLIVLKERGLALGAAQWKYRLEKWLLTGIRYDHEISVSRHFLSYLNVNETVSVIPNGVETHEFDAITVPKRFKFTLLFVGREDPLKGLKYLEEAMNIVRRSHPEIRLIKVGSRKTTGKKLLQTYKSAHLFVLPSLSEGHPLTILEARAAKLPVIVTSVGDNPTMVEDGVNGYLIPPADTEALVTAILKAYSNPELAKMGIAGYNLVKNYTWEKAAKSTLRIYQEVTSATR